MINVRPAAIQISQMPRVVTVGDLVAWLRQRSERHAEALAEGAAFGAAVDKRTATMDVVIGKAQEVAFFPPFTGG